MTSCSRPRGATRPSNRSEGQNSFAGVVDVAGEAGIEGASTDPFDWGVPDLSFTTLTSLRDRVPSYHLDRRFTASEVATRSWGKHNVRFGGGFRTQSLDSETDTNARGSFVFTGFYTSGIADGTVIPGTGSDFADFLLGRAQQASVQYGPGRVRFHGNAWSAFLQDDWRVGANRTLNLGVRYEYVSPLEEENGHLVNLDVPPDFAAAVPVLAGEAGAFTGPFPASLVNGDWNNVAPRVGVAWKAKSDLTVRGGFGINYNLGAYPAIAQHLAGQPPFAVSNTLLGTPTFALPLSTALTLPGEAVAAAPDGLGGRRLVVLLFDSNGMEPEQLERAVLPRQGRHGDRPERDPRGLQHPALYFYFEVYDPAREPAGDVRVLTNLAFFRGNVRRYETPVVEVKRLAAPDRHAAVLELAVPAASLKPGLYTCQVNVIDDVAGSFAFPRVALLVRQ